MVQAPYSPLYEGGWNLAGLGRARAYMTTGVGTKKPFIATGRPLGLGQSQPVGPNVLKATAPIVGTATTAILAPMVSSGAAAGAGGGAAAGSIAGPIGAGVGILVGIIAGLWAAHSARVAGATHENQAINSAVQAWDASMKAIFAAANSSDPTQNISGADAAQQVSAVWAQFWQAMSPYMHAPGTADASMGGANCGNGTLNPSGPCAGTPGGHMCNNSCTATCCVGCQDLYPSYLQAIQVLNSPAGGTVQVCAVSPSSYGAQSRAGYTLSYTPPAISPAAGLTSGLSSLFGGAAGGSSWLPLLAIGAAAFFLLRS
jgi:hypothetical protein